MWRRWIEAAYLTLRPSFSDKDAIYAYRTEYRVGRQALEPGVSRIRAARVAFVARPTTTGEMYGILTTLQAGRGSQLIPIAAPMVLVRMRVIGDAHLGQITAEHPSYAAYRKYLQRTVDEPFALFLPG